MVFTSAPLACTARIVQDFTARPFKCTVQAPHWLVSQPTWVPVSAEMLAQKINQQRSRFDNGFVLYAIDGDIDRHRCVFRLGSHAQNSSVSVA